MSAGGEMGELRNKVLEEVSWSGILRIGRRSRRGGTQIGLIAEEGGQKLHNGRDCHFIYPILCNSVVYDYACYPKVLFDPGTNLKAI